MKRLLTALIVFTFFSPGLAGASWEEMFLVELVSGHQELNENDQQTIERISTVESIFRNSVLAFLSTWDHTPFRRLTGELRLRLARHAVKSADPVFETMPDELLNSALLFYYGRIQQDKGHQTSTIDLIACRVLQNIFPIATRQNQEHARFLAFSKRKMKGYRRMIKDEIRVALKERQMPPILTKWDRDRLVEHFSKISFGAMGLTRIRRAAQSYAQAQLEESIQELLAAPPLLRLLAGGSF